MIGEDSLQGIVPHARIFRRPISIVKPMPNIRAEKFIVVWLTRDRQVFPRTCVKGRIPGARWGSFILERGLGALEKICCRYRLMSGRDVCISACQIDPGSFGGCNSSERVEAHPTRPLFTRGHVVKHVTSRASRSFSFPIGRENGRRVWEAFSKSFWRFSIGLFGFTT